MEVSKDATNRSPESILSEIERLRDDIEKSNKFRTNLVSFMEKSLETIPSFSFHYPYHSAGSEIVEDVRVWLDSTVDSIERKNDKSIQRIRILKQLYGKKQREEENPYFQLREESEKSFKEVNSIFNSIGVRCEAIEIHLKTKDNESVAFRQTNYI